MRYLFICLFIYLFNISFAQEMALGWQACFGSEATKDGLHAIDVMPDGNIICCLDVSGYNAAFTNYHGESEADGWVLILDNDGNIINDRCFGGSEDDTFFDIEIYNDNIYFFGITQSTDGDAQSPQIGGLTDIWVVKTDLDLNIIWERKYGNLGPILPVVAKATPTGGLVFGANFFQEAGGDVTHYYGQTDIWLCEIDPNGEIIWETTMGNSGENKVADLLITDHGTLMVFGETESTGGMIECNFHPSTTGYYRDFWISELDNKGETIWQECYGGTHHEQGFDIIAEDNGYTLLGFAYSNNGDVSGNHGWESKDYWLIHIDETGNLEWQNCFGGSDSEVGFQIFKTEDNGYVLLGIANSDNGDVTHNHCWTNGADCNMDPWVIVTDSNRNILWENTFGGLQNGQMERNSAVQIGEMDFIITSAKYHEGEEFEDITSDFNCTAYPVENEYSAWIFRLRDCEKNLEDNAPLKPNGIDSLCIEKYTKSYFTTEIKYPKYNAIEWIIEPEYAADLVSEDTSVTVHWRNYYEGQASIMARIITDCGESDYSEPKIVKVSNCTGLAEQAYRSLKVYPNPAQSQITFDLPIITKESEIEIKDIYGRTITELRAIPGQTQIQWNLQNIASGVYFYQAEINGLIYRGKVVIQ